MAHSLPSTCVERILGNAQRLSMKLAAQSGERLTFFLPPFFQDSDKFDLSWQLLEGLTGDEALSITGYFDGDRFTVVPWGEEPPDIWS